MAPRSIRIIRVVCFLLLLFAILAPLSRASALSLDLRAHDLPSLHLFISQVKNGQPDELRGIYIPEVLAAHVVSQPAGDHVFVSPRQSILTQFNLSSLFGSTGLLAHNYLAGESFSLLEEGQKFHLVYGDGQTLTYVVTEIRRYQALEPDSTTGNFVDLETRDVLTAHALFSEVYDRPGNVIFQTCIPRDNELNWGRLFIIAEPDLTE